MMKRLAITPKALGFFVISQSSQIAAVYCAKFITATPFDWFNPYYYLFACCLLTQAFSWQQVLKTTPLSQIYPATSIQFPLLLFLGWWFFDESVNLKQMIGMLMIMAGVYLLLDKPQKKPQDKR